MSVLLDEEMFELTKNLRLWAPLPIWPAGKINSIKMVIMQRMLYYFQTSQSSPAAKMFLYRAEQTHFKVQGSLICH